MANGDTREYVVIPRDGLGSRTAEALSALGSFPTAVSTEEPGFFALSPTGHDEVKVVDSVYETGPRLIEASDRAVARINAANAPLRAFPIVYYDLPDPWRGFAGNLSAVPHAPTKKITIECRESGTGTPISGCMVTVFSNYAAGQGVQDRTDSSGQVVLAYDADRIDRLYVETEPTHWGAYRTQLAVPTDRRVQVDIDALDLNIVDAVRHYYGSSRFDDDAEVKVGVLDTGVGPHRDLNVAVGLNTVTGEGASDFEDWHGHGTHVAGLIGSNGHPPNGVRGVAPNVSLQAYRVFGGGARGASNYAILKAMIMAASNACDILNLSLGGGPFDPIVEESIQDARNQGMLVIVAAGNDGRKPVSYPAAYPGATAVSALGREDAMPSGCIYQADVERPPISAVDPAEFIAAFSNVGPQIAVTGPGSGVVSTLPNNRHGPMSGTSMAAPVVAGAAACLLSRNSSHLTMSRDRARSDAIERLVQSACTSSQFGAQYEGYGLPDPTKV